MIRIQIRAVKDNDADYKALSTVSVTEQVWERFLAQSVGESPTARLAEAVEQALGVDDSAGE